MSEPDIVVNGRVLTIAESMTVRVALESFAGDLAHHGLGDDEVGRAICAGYLRNIDSIRETMYRDRAVKSHD